MGLLLQIFGFLTIVVSIVLNIIAAVKNRSTTVGTIMFVIGIVLMNVGRKIHNGNNKS